MKPIAGALDMQALEQLHRPLDRDTARVAARELSARGLTAADISTAIGIAEPAVRELLDLHQERTP